MLMNRVCNSCVGDVHKFEIGLDLWILHLGVIVLQEMERVINCDEFILSCPRSSVISDIAVASLSYCIKGAILMVPVRGRRLIGSARAHLASPTVITIVTASFVRS
jgi:hypothetical protein